MEISIKPLGHIYRHEPKSDWAITHAQVPFLFKVNETEYRVYYSTRDSKSRSSVTFVSLDVETLTIHESSIDAPLLTRGKPGTFDDSGTMPSWIVEHNNELWMYYTAWNRSKNASYRLSIGLAKSIDGGLTFHKMFKGPILDRGRNDPIWVGQPCVLKDDDIWKMWYLSCQKISIIESIPEPFYNVRYATSDDGINWNREEITCIDFDENTDAIGRPCVWIYDGKYFMLHSNRKATGYRTDSEAGYRIVLSTSENGKSWNQVETFQVSKNEAWANVMTEYCSVAPTEKEGTFLVLYNGNGFGASGFGGLLLTIS